MTSGEEDAPLTTRNSPLATFTVPVLLDRPRPDGSTGMTEAILALQYDPAQLSLATIALGTIPAQESGWQLSWAVDRTTGQIGIILYSTAPVDVPDPGSLVHIAFNVLPAARSTGASVQLVGSTRVDGREYRTQVDDAQGQLVLGPGGDWQVTLPGRRAGGNPLPRARA